MHDSIIKKVYKNKKCFSAVLLYKNESKIEDGSAGLNIEFNQKCLKKMKQILFSEGKYTHVHFCRY